MQVHHIWGILHHSQVKEGSGIPSAFREHPLVTDATDRPLEIQARKLRPRFLAKTITWVALGSVTEQSKTPREESGENWSGTS